VRNEAGKTDLGTTLNGNFPCYTDLTITPNAPTRLGAGGAVCVRSTVNGRAGVRLHAPNDAKILIDAGILGPAESTARSVDAVPAVGDAIHLVAVLHASESLLFALTGLNARCTRYVVSASTPSAIVCSRAARAVGVGGAVALVGPHATAAGSGSDDTLPCARTPATV